MTEWLAVLVPALGWALLHFVWQGVLIGLIAWLVLSLLHNARPQARYAVACLALLACALLPLWQVCRSLNIDAAHITTTAVPGAVIGATDAAPNALSFILWPSAFDAALPWVVALWAAGACMLSLRMAVGLTWTYRLRLSAETNRHSGWQARLDRLVQQFGIRRAVALRVINDGDSLVCAGFWRPIVLVPAALLARMPTDLLEALLAHELAHIRRHDYLINLLQSAVEALLFYHPVVWWLSRRIRVEREHVADDLAAIALGEPRRLAVALSELDRFAFPPPQFAQAAHGGQLMSRIQQLIRPHHRATGGKIAFPLLGLAAACIAFYAHGQIARKDTTTNTVTERMQVVARSHARAQNDDRHETYALVRKGSDGISMSGSTDDIDAIDAAREKIDGDFLWFRRQGKAYVVRDPSLLARAEQEWKATAKLDDQMEALSRQMEGHSAKMEALSQRMEMLSAQASESSAMRQATEKLQALASQQQGLAQQQGRIAQAMAGADGNALERLDQEMQALDTQLEALDGRMEALNSTIEAETERLEIHQQPIEALSQEMEIASQPMEAIGDEMELLGEKQEKVVAEVDRSVRALIDEAFEKGLAIPAPDTKQQ